MDMKNLNKEEQQTAIDFLWMFLRECESKQKDDPVMKHWTGQCHDFLKRIGVEPK